MPIFSNDILELARSCIELARAKRLTIACAESCTAGLVSSALGSISGSSEAFLGSVVSYAIPVKAELLGVSRSILDDPALGAVSCECALEMAQGVRELMDASVAVSVTGIAGPTGAEPGKPVGTVWIASSSRSVHSGHLFHFEGDRSEVRLSACREALRLLYEVLMDSENLA